MLQMQAALSAMFVCMTIIIIIDSGRHTLVTAVKHLGLLLSTEAPVIMPSSINFFAVTFGPVLFVLQRCCAMQVLPTLPLHKDTPFARYALLEMPQYSVDFTSFEPMEPQVMQSKQIA